MGQETLCKDIWRTLGPVLLGWWLPWMPLGDYGGRIVGFRGFSEEQMGYSRGGREALQDQ